mmetsp:Transcript_54216/g.172089  ORF Transcript_54216/g.172089 Transcript_54216/m.172089 type:complete len:219 (-) Transcript_54216:1052-1708(-)
MGKVLQYSLPGHKPMLCLRLAPLNPARPPPSAKWGSQVTPMPTPSAMARMKRLRRVMGSLAMIAMPETITLANRKIVMPPSTQSGMEAITPANFPRTPKRISQMAHEMPAAREAQRVRAITPLFWEKVVLGGVVMKPAMKELIPSASRPPWTRESASSPSDGISDTSQDALMSPAVSMVEIMKPMRMGRKAGAWNPSLKVFTQRKVKASASSILVEVT